MLIPRRRRSPVARAALLLALAWSFGLRAAEHYVDLHNASPAAPYTSWSTAANNIQDAIDAANDGDLILVTNGVYTTGSRVVYGALANRVVINRAVTVQSVNGPAATIIQGNHVLDNTAVRCVYMTNNAVISGFTITNGATRNAGDATTEQSAGGIYCESTNAVIANCVVSGNIAQSNGGGVYQGTLTNCTVQGNSCGAFLAGIGGGAWNSVLVNCTVNGNRAGHQGGAGFGCTFDFCTLTLNGGVLGGAANSSVLRNCVLANNICDGFGGGAYASSLTNCLIISNTAACSYCAFTSGSSGAASTCSLVNCTLVGNYAEDDAGGVDAKSQVINCIIYYNSCGAGPDPNYQGGMTMNSSCSMPLPAGAGNITNAPLFVNPAGDYHLQGGSYCINVGNDTAAGLPSDVEGNPRIVGDGVDMGAYEYQVSLPLTVTIQTATTNLETGAPLTLQGILQGGTATVLRWDFGDGNIATNQLSVTHNWAAPGTYLVTLLVSNDFTPGGATAAVTINASNSPPIILKQPQDQFGVIFSNVTFSISAGGSRPLAYQWQFNGVNLAGATNTSLTVTNLQVPNEGYYDVIVSNGFGSTTSSIALLSVSRVVIWGTPNSQPAGLTNVISVTGFPAALRGDGTVVRWSGTPLTVVSGLSNVIAIASGFSTNTALRTNGDVWIWTQTSARKLTGSGATNVAVISACNNKDLAIRPDGTLAGSNLSGAPAAVTNLTNAVAIAQGRQHSLVLKADGTVLAWGANTFGTVTSVPTGLSNVVAIAAGTSQSMALRNDGKLVLWGDPSMTNAAAGLSNVVAIVAGDHHNLALRSDGTVAVWGYDFSGETVVPAGLSNVVMIAVGQSQLPSTHQYFSMALVGSGPPIMWASLNNATVGSNGFSVNLPTQSGRVYMLQYKNLVTDSQWASLPLVPGNGGMQTLTDPSSTNGQRIYRVLRW